METSQSLNSLQKFARFLALENPLIYITQGTGVARLSLIRSKDNEVDKRQFNLLEYF